MTQWWNSLSGADQIFWGVALLSSVFFLLQAIAVLVGIGDADGIDSDAPSDAVIDGADGAIDLFTVRNTVNFLLGFGWSGVCLRQVIPSTPLLVIVSIAVGVAFVALFVFVFKQLMRLEKHGNVDFRDAIGSVQSVYLRIPGHMAGRGKVQLSIDGSVYEVDAMTHGADIASGQKVRLVEMEGTSAYIVEEI